MVDCCKRSGFLLRVADQLGRGRGRWRLGERWWSFPIESGCAAPPALPVASLGTTDFAWALGHATVLLRLGGVTVLTDPVFSSRIGLGVGPLTLGPRRRVPPAVALGGLPPLDLVLVSHAHFDHLDRPTLDRLARRRPDVPVVTAVGCADLLTDLGFRDVRELAWEQATTVGQLTVTAVPVRHWGARVFADRHRGYAAFVLEADGRRVLFGADSAYFDGWRPLGDAGGVELAVVGIGAYDPYVAAHATPEQAVEMATMAGARAVMPMHFGVFRLSHEPMDEPLRRFRHACERAGLRRVADDIGSHVVLGHGTAADGTPTHVIRSVPSSGASIDEGYHAPEATPATGGNGTR